MVVAWCLKDMGPVKESIHPDTDISHGICASCRDNVILREEVRFQRYIDSFAIPIFVVDSNARVMAVNRGACEVLGKEPTAIVQHLSGNVFECEHARLPEGCGATIHCSGCTIRKTVTKCFTTGKPPKYGTRIPQSGLSHVKNSLNNDGEDRRFGNATGRSIGIAT